MRLLDEISSHQKVLQLGRKGEACCSRSSCCTREDEGRRDQLLACCCAQNERRETPSLAVQRTLR